MLAHHELLAEVLLDDRVDLGDRLVVELGDLHARHFE